VHDAFFTVVVLVDVEVVIIFFAVVVVCVLVVNFDCLVVVELSILTSVINPYSILEIIQL
jgi:hypothetical protein